MFNQQRSKMGSQQRNEETSIIIIIKGNNSLKVKGNYYKCQMICVL